MFASSAQQEKPRCNICWKDANTFLIGWIDTVRICNIRRRSAAEMALTPNWPQFTVEPGNVYNKNKCLQLQLQHYFN